MAWLLYTNFFLLSISGILFVSAAQRQKQSLVILRESRNIANRALMANRKFR